MQSTKQQSYKICEAKSGKIERSSQIHTYIWKLQSNSLNDC